MRNTYRVLPLALLALLLAVPVSATSSPPPASGDLTLLQKLFVLKEMKPDVKRVGIIAKKGIAKKQSYMKKLKRAQAATKIKVIISFASSLQDVGPEFRNLVNKHNVEALWILANDGLVDKSVSRSFLIKNAAKKGIPILAPTKDWVSAGPCVMFQKTANGIQIIANKSTTTAMALSIPEKYKEQAQLL